MAQQGMIKSAYTYVVIYISMLFQVSFYPYMVVCTFLNTYLETIQKPWFGLTKAQQIYEQSVKTQKTY